MKINGSPRSAWVFAIDETLCLATDSSDMDRLSGNDRIAFGYILFRVFAEILASRLRLTSQDLTGAKEEIARLRSEENKQKSSERPSQSLIRKCSCGFTI